MTIILIEGMIFDMDDYSSSSFRGFPRDIHGRWPYHRQSCLVAYRGNGARDMTSGVELFFISFVFVLMSSLASGSLRCPFGVMRDGPHVGKIRSRDPPWYPWLHFLLNFFFRLSSFGDVYFSAIWKIIKKIKINKKYENMIFFDFF